MSKKLKVGLVFDDSLDKPDGVQQFVLILGQWLSDAGHEVRYLSGETKRSDLPGLHSLARNVKVRFNKNRMAMPLPADRRRIKQVLAAEEFDILHVQMPYSPLLAGRIITAASPRAAIIGTFHVAPHSGVVGMANRLLGLWSRPTLRRFNVFTATSTASRDFAKKTFKIDCQVVPLPLKLDGFSGAHPLDKYKRGKHVVFLGRLVERKGCQHLLKAVALAVNNSTWPERAKVIICGDGPLGLELKKFVNAKGLKAVVEFAGQISESDKPRYLASADIAVFPSTGGESFGVVLLEAMAACPGLLLAGNNPGYASVMADHTQQLFDALDTPALAKRLVTALGNDKLRAEASAWQKKYVINFDVAHIGQQFVDIYAAALHKRRS